MRLGTGHPDCPRRQGESFTQYMARLANYLGYKVEQPLVKKWPRVEKSFSERLSEIWAPREPGEDE
jgi:hypothetical protein